MNKTKKSRKVPNSLYVIAGIVMAALAPLAYSSINTLTVMTCPDEVYNDCDFSYGLGGYYLSIAVSTLMVIAAIILIVSGIIKLTKTKTPRRK